MTENKPIKKDTINKELYLSFKSPCLRILTAATISSLSFGYY